MDIGRHRCGAEQTRIKHADRLRMETLNLTPQKASELWKITPNNKIIARLQGCELAKGTKSQLNGVARKRQLLS